MDTRYAQYDGQFPEDEAAARAMLWEAFAEFPYWAQLATMVADVCSERIDDAERRAMWHEHYGRHEQAVKAMDWVPVYEKMHRLAHLIRHVDMLSSVRDVVEAVVARHRPNTPGTKDNPINVGDKSPRKSRGGDHGQKG